MLILTVGLLGLLQSLQLGYRQSLRDRMREEAVQLAEEQMHDLRRLPYTKIDYDSDDEVNKKVGGGEVTFKVVKGMDENSSRTAKKLRVTVSWTANGERLYHEIFTLRNRRADEY